MIMLKKSLFFVFLLLIALIPLGTCTPSDEGFSHYVTISLDHDDVDATLTDFPVLIHLSDSCGINSFDATAIFEEIGDQYNYSAFEDTDENRLFFEVEYWSSSDVEAFIWVKIPSISADSDTEIIFWFEKFVDGSEYNSPSDVWDSNFKMVQHMNDATTSTILDSTSNDNDGDKKAVNEPIETTGQIGKAQNFDGTDDYINCGDVDLNTLTLSLWIKGDLALQSAQNNYVLSKENSFAFRVADTSNGDFLTFLSYSGGARYDLSDVPVGHLDTNNNHIVVTYGANHIIFYLNGTEIKDINQTGNLDQNNNNLIIGAYSAAYGYFKGIIDSVRISNINRSSAWVGASYETQRDNFCSFGPITLYVADVPSRGEFLAAGMILALIVVPLFIFVMFALRRRR